MTNSTIPDGLLTAVITALQQEEVLRTHDDAMGRSRILHGVRGALRAWKDGEIPENEAIAQIMRALIDA